jgi:hypothetical protein
MNRQKFKTSDQQQRGMGPALNKVVVLLPPALTESFELVLARVVNLSSANVTVQVLHCDGAVKGCVANPFGIKSVCRHCRKIRDVALSNMPTQCERISLDVFVASKQREWFELPKEVNQELKRGVESTILTFYRRFVNLSSPSLSARLYRTLENRYMQHSQFVYHAVTNFLKHNKVSRIEFFNGRIVPTLAAMYAAKNTPLSYAVIEVSGHARQLFTTDNQSVHDLKHSQSALHDFIETGSFNPEIGKDFFELRRSGIATDARSFIKGQKRGMLRLVKCKPILAVFTSSADELQVGGDQWFTHASINPITFIHRIAELLSNSYHIVVRMHPNQAGDRTGAAKEMIRALSHYDGIDLIKPTDVHSTYELIDSSRAVITFGSSVGLEATYWDKPSILAGRALWDQLDVAYFVETPEQIKNLLLGELVARSKSDAVAVGAYYMIGQGKPSALSWGKNGSVGFSVNGRSYLREKRSSVSYWVTRVIDRALRML